MIEFHLLGSLEAVDDGTPVGLGAPRQRALLAVLLIHRGRIVSADALVDALWAEHQTPASAAKIVQGYVSNLRRAIGPETLTTEGRGYRLHVDADATDAGRFEALATQGRLALERGDAETAATTLRKALELWRGPALAEFADEPFARAEASRLQEARLTALEQRIDADLALGGHAGAIGELQQLLHAHPLQEAFAAQLMLALYRSGRQADALECYRDIRARLVDELGLEPGRALRERQQAILDQDPALEGVHVPAPPAPDARPPQRRRRRRSTVVLAVALCAVALAAGLTLVARGLGHHRADAFADRSNSIVAIDPQGDRVAATVAVGARPGAIDVGAGSLWVADRNDQLISQVDPDTLQTVRQIPLNAPPNSIATAGGRIWVAGASASAPFIAVNAIDPHFGVVDAAIRIPSVYAGSIGSLAPHGSSVWVAADSGELTRIDALTASVARRIDPNSGPTSIAVDGTGAVWMADSEGNDVIEIDPAGTITTIPVGHQPASIAVGDHAIWVTDSDDDALVRIDPATRAVTNTVQVGRAPLGIAVVPGSVWVANSGDGTVSRIDPESDHVVATIRVGGSPQELAVDGRRIWVTVDAPHVSSGAPAGGTLRVVSGIDVDSMDPALAYNGLSQQLLDATCAKLVNYPDRTGAASSELIPEVAQSLPVASDGGRAYTFTVRRGFRFSPPSGAPVTAETFKTTIDRVLNPRMHSPVAWEYLDIVGARAFHAGRTTTLTGVVARGDQLIIHLTAPAPDLVARMAEPAMCAVPTDTPITARGVPLIPSAGPYHVTSYAPGQGIVLTRNPNYRGDRPHHASRIVVQVNTPADRAIHEIERSQADVTRGVDFTPAQAASLTRRYGPGSGADRAGGKPTLETPPAGGVDFLALNTHRPLFSHLRLREAVNYAIDRRALASLGNAYVPLGEHPTSTYLPASVPGYRDVEVYPNRPDLARARALAKGFAGSTVTFATCDVSPCGDQARILARELAAIGLHLRVDAMPIETLNTEQESPHGRFDMTWQDWAPDYLDPEAMLNVLVASSAVVPSFVSPRWQLRLAAAARLSGTRRDLAYARLDLELARDAAPLAAFGSPSIPDLFSARVGCRTFTPYGVDLAALCLKR